MGPNTPTSRKARADTQRRTRYSVGAQITREDYDRVMAECQLRGCTPSELVRAALRLDEVPHLRPMLAAAGQLIRAGNAHAAASRRGEWKAAAIGIDQLNAHAAELIRIVAEDRGRR